MAGTDEAAIGVRAAHAEAARVHDRHGPAGARKVVGAAGANDAAAHNDDGTRLAHARMPVRKGSLESSSRVASAVTKAEPVTRGMTWPSRIRMLPSKMLPTMLSCRQTSPSLSLPSA